MSLKERARVWLRPPRKLKATRIGQTYLVITVGVGLAALNTGNNLLYLVLGFLLSIIVLSGVLSERIIRDLHVKRILPEGVFAQESFPLRYQVTRHRGRAFAVRIAEGSDTLPGWAWIPTIEAGRPVVARTDSIATVRGPLKLQEVQVSTFFPFGLFEKSRRVELSDVLVVWPKRSPARESPVSDVGSVVGETGHQRQRDGSGDILGLRELGENEDARGVHWKKSASSSKLLKVEREREERRQFTLRVTEHILSQTLEQDCEKTAALASYLLAQGHEVGLHAGPRHLRPSSGPGHEKRILRALAMLGYETQEPAP